MPARTPRRFYLIDALRGFAASWVVLFHIYIGGDVDRFLALLPDLLSRFLFEWGVAGVPVFFVISGFVIAHSVGRDQVDGRYLARFTLRRSLRLDPPYWASIILIVSLTSLASLIQNEPVVLPSGAQTLAHMFYLQDILEYPQIGVIYWTLCLEIQFYLIYVVLVMLAQKISRVSQVPLLAIFFAAALVSLLWPTGMLTENIYPGLFFPHWHAFLLGVFVYLTMRGLIDIRWSLAFSVVVLVSAIASQELFSVAAGVTSLFVLFAARFEQLYALNWRPLQFLGKISYSLYLTHDVIVFVSLYVFFAVLPHTAATELLAIAAIFGGCVVFAWAFWLLFERWSIQLSKLISLREKPKSVVELPDRVLAAGGEGSR
jgi:peptidoglycan/LPS O-acetylase OafA/YrhL